MDVEHADMVEKQLDALIQRRARKGDVDPDELDPGYMESVRAYEEKRRQMARVEWHLHHTAQAERLRRTLEELASHHESEAARLMEATDERSLGEQSTARQRLARQGDKPQAYEIPRPRIRGVGEGARPCEKAHRPIVGLRKEMEIEMSENLAALPTPQEVEDEITEQRSIGVTAHLKSGVS